MIRYDYVFFCIIHIMITFHMLNIVEFYVFILTFYYNQKVDACMIHHISFLVFLKHCGEVLLIIDSQYILHMIVLAVGLW